MTDQIIQGSPEWFAARLGKVTASKVSAVMARTKTGVSATRNTYMGQLIAERLSNNVQRGYVSQDMEHGIEQEPHARAAYEFETGRKVTVTGFIQHPHFVHAGASPDGLVGDDGLIEIKCPQTMTHINTLRKRTYPAEYRHQMQWQMACTGRQWCDFVSYDPCLPGHLQLAVYRLERDPAHIADLEAAVGAFLDELQAEIDWLNKLELFCDNVPATTALEVL